MKQQTNERTLNNKKTKQKTHSVEWRKGRKNGRGSRYTHAGYMEFIFPYSRKEKKKFLFLNTTIQIEFTRFLAEPEFLGIEPTAF